MRHRRHNNRLKQKPGHARMFKRNLLTSLLLYESVRTTKKRASVIAPEVDKLINFAKKHTPHVAIRHLNKTVTDTNASKKVMEVFIKRYAKRDSGLTRTVAAGFRPGDGAEVVDLSLVDGEVVVAPVEKKSPTKKSE
ncbi:MAG: bL17 family ribosomal protein [Candidatus Peribacteraceae bacterium]|nr:bL17 family ribosomal protein [Candidatus Peribacteraceae bacterium]MDP7477254.1 bL17 family ribosomal protein [Candidatus Peribacteraceae bacterium]